MEYRFNMTPRLMGIGLFCLLTLLILLFLLGIQIGKKIGSANQNALLHGAVQMQKEAVSNEVDQVKKSLGAAVESGKKSLEK